MAQKYTDQQLAEAGALARLEASQGKAPKPTKYQKQVGKLEWGDQFTGASDRLWDIAGQAGGLADRAAGRGAASINRGTSDQFRTQQNQLAAALADQAAGRGGPSPAEAMLRANRDLAVRQGASQIASQAGINPALAARMQNESTAMALSDFGNQAAQLRAQEQLAAQNALGGLLGQARGQDIGLEQANLEAELRQRGYNDDMVKAMMLAKFGSLGQMSQQAQARNTLAYQAEQGMNAAADQREMQILGAVLSGLGSAGAAYAGK